MNHHSTSASDVTDCGAALVPGLAEVMSEHPVTVTLGRNLPDHAPEPPLYSGVVCQNRAGYIWVFYHNGQGWRAAASGDTRYIWGEILRNFVVLAVFSARTTQPSFR